MRLLRIRRGARFGWATALVMSATPALAAPFCIQSQTLPPQCNYYDAQECQHDAARQGGVCSVNPQQKAMLQPGEGQYCIVTSGGASACVYADRGTCMREAEREGAACTTAPTIAPAKAPDPYAAVGGL